MGDVRGIDDVVCVGQQITVSERHALRRPRRAGGELNQCDVVGPDLGHIRLDLTPVRGAIFGNKDTLLPIDHTETTLGTDGVQPLEHGLVVDCQPRVRQNVPNVIEFLEISVAVWRTQRYRDKPTEQGCPVRGHDASHRPVGDHEFVSTFNTASLQVGEKATGTLAEFFIGPSVHLSMLTDHTNPGAAFPLSQECRRERVETCHNCQPLVLRPNFLKP